MPDSEALVGMVIADDNSRVKSASEQLKPVMAMTFEPPKYNPHTCLCQLPMLAYES